MGTNLLNFPSLPADQPGGLLIRILIIVSLTAATHLLVWLVRAVSDWLITNSAARRNPVGFVTKKPKFVTLTGLIASALTFIIYSIALGFVLHVFGVNSQKFLTTYLATASVIGLAVGFGSQGLVQDVVMGLTLIFSDTLDVGDLIEVSGQTGRVQKVGLRFTELRNFLNQQVFVPNRMIGNIGRFPAGGIQAYADVQIPEVPDRERIVERIHRITEGTWKQFDAIILEEPQISGMETGNPGGWAYVRIQFKLWPGQTAVIETAFRQRIVAMMKALQPAYAEWMVPITFRATLPSRGKGNFVI